MTAIEAQVQSFVTLYNTTVEAMQKQLTTKPPTNPQNAKNSATGSLFGDADLTSLLSRMRQTMYEPIVGLPAKWRAHRPSASAPARPHRHLLAVLARRAAEARSGEARQRARSQPRRRQDDAAEGGRSASQKTINQTAEPGGSLETRVNGDGEQIIAA